MTPKVSICCITYNHGRYIGETIESFLNQNFPYPFEIIVSDDRSSDNTVSILNSYNAKFPNLIKFHVNDLNLGMMQNFTQVFKYAKGEYIAYCDGDDFWTDPDKLKRQVEILDENKDLSFVFHDVSIVDETGRETGVLSKGRITEFLSSCVISSKSVIGAPLRIVHANALLFHRKSLGDMSYLNFFKDSPAPDFTLVTLLASQGDGYYINKKMSAYRKHTNSVSNTRENDKKLLYRFKHFYTKLDEYFSNRFHSEFLKGYKGHVIMSIENNMNQSIEKKNFFSFFFNSLRLFRNYRGSQYSLKDVLWLTKEGIRKIFLKKI